MRNLLHALMTPFFVLYSGAFVIDSGADVWWVILLGLWCFVAGVEVATWFIDR